MKKCPLWRSVKIGKRDSGSHAHIHYRERVFWDFFLGNCGHSPPFFPHSECFLPNAATQSRQTTYRLGFSPGARGWIMSCTALANTSLSGAGGCRAALREVYSLSPSSLREFALPSLSLEKRRFIVLVRDLGFCGSVRWGRTRLGFALPLLFLHTRRLKQHNHTSFVDARSFPFMCAFLLIKSVLQYYAAPLLPSHCLFVCLRNNTNKSQNTTTKAPSIDKNFVWILPRYSITTSMNIFD